MKLQTPSSRALREALQVAAKCVAPKTSLPVLEGILVVQQNGRFYFTSSTQDSQLTIPAPLDIVDGKFEHPFVIQPKNLIAFLGTMPDSVVTLSVSDSLQVSLEYCTGNDDARTGKASFTAFSGQEFPLLKGVDKTCNDDVLRLSLPARYFLSVLDYSKEFAANDDLRPVMNTLCIDIPLDTPECYFVATDGHKLVKTTYSQNVLSDSKSAMDFCRKNSMNNARVLVNRVFFPAFTAFSSAETIDIAFDGTSIHFSSPEAELIIKSPEARYPNYKSVIPRGNNEVICFNKKEMLDVLNRVSIFGSASMNLVVLKKDGMFVTLQAQDIDFSTEAQDQVLVTSGTCSEGFTIGFNSQSFSKTVAAIPADDIRMELSAPDKPAIMTENSPNATVLTLCMPMAIQ